MIPIADHTRDRSGDHPSRVLVATDASPASAGAEAAGIELAARTAASLIVVSVIDPSRLRLASGLFHTRVDQVRAEREAALSLVVNDARLRGVPAHYLIWEGEPGPSVIEAAQAEEVDVVVVGSHGRGPIGRLLLGSVSSHVVAHEQRRVIVIGPGQGLDDVWTMPPTTSLRAAG
jgi:nucleotide-binding universal stress UspA family protein